MISTAWAIARAVETWSPVSLHADEPRGFTKNNGKDEHVNNDTGSLASPDSAKRLRPWRVGDTSQGEESEVLLSVLASDACNLVARDRAVSETNDAQPRGGELFIFDHKCITNFVRQRGCGVRFRLRVGDVGGGGSQNTFSLWKRRLSGEDKRKAKPRTAPLMKTSP